MYQLIAATEMRTRLIQPFRFDDRSWTPMIDALVRAEVLGRGGAWEAAPPHDYYLDELLPQAARYMFSLGEEADPSTGRLGCRYFRLHNDVRNRLLADTESDFCVGTRDVRLTDQSPVEMFVSPLGIGFLSLSVRPTAPIPRSFLLDFNYRLASLGRKSSSLRNRHPQDDEVKWSRIPPEHRQKIPPPPPLDAPVSERITKPGGTYYIHELVDALMAPLDAYGRRSTQKCLSVFSVVRLAESADFAIRDVAQEIGPVLVSLAQIEEYRHAGAAPDDLGIPEELLNRRHWTAASTYGNVHFVSDQPPEADGRAIDFNDERVPRIFHKYFVPFAAGMLQRMIAEQTAERSASLMLRPVKEYAAVLPELRHQFLEHMLAGAFEQVSLRPAVQRSFRVVQAALETCEIGAHVRHAISELDAKLTTDLSATIQQSTLDTQRNTLKTQRSALRTQHIAEQLEVVIVAVYLAELWHHLTVHLNKPHESHGFWNTLWHGVEIGGRVWHFDVLLVALLGGLATWLYLHRSKSSDH